MIRVPALCAMLLTIWPAASISGPLHDAVKASDAAAIEGLLAGNADPDEIDFFAGSPLHVASRVGNAGIARMLIEAGADVEIREYGLNETPLHSAAASGRVDE